MFGIYQEKEKEGNEMEVGKERMIRRKRKRTMMWKISQVKRVYGKLNGLCYGHSTEEKDKIRRIIQSSYNHQRTNTWNIGKA